MSERRLPNVSHDRDTGRQQPFVCVFEAAPVAPPRGDLDSQLPVAMTTARVHIAGCGAAVGDDCASGAGETGGGG